MVRIGLVGLVLALASGGAASAEDICAKVTPALPGAICVNTPHGAAMAPDAARANQLAGYATAGEQRFQAHFGREATPYVVYEMVGDIAQTKATNAALLDLGYKRVLPWMSRKAQKDAMTKGLNEGTIPRLRAEGRSEDLIASFVSQRLAALDGDIDRREAAVVPHELAHQWYVEAGWPGARGDSGGHYAGPGPDWMDELSAILAETDADADRRRGQFKDFYTGARQGVSRTDLLDLTLLLDQVHPEHARRAAAPAAPSPPGVTMRVVNSPTGAFSEANLFYVKNRMVGDFLIAKTGDPAIFGSILEAFRRGETFDQWLATQGRAKGLAPDRAGLDQQWRDWLKSSLGEPKVA